MIWPALIAGGLGLAGGFLSQRTQKGEALKTREFSADQANIQRDYSSAQADKQRAFQERMRNTSWQAGIADMEAAGMNPALAYSQGGAASPGGAMGSAGMGSGAMASVQDVISPALNSAMQMKRMQQELKNMKQSEDTALAQKYKFDQDARESRARELNIDELRPGIGWNNEMLRLGLPGARNIANFEGGSFGQKTRTVRSLLQSVFGSGGAFRAR